MKKLINKIDIFALGPSVFLYYSLIFYFAPILVLLGFSNQTFDLYKSISFHALAFSFIGLVFLVLGYTSGIHRLFVKSIPNVLKEEWRERNILYVFLASFFVGLFAKILNISGGFYYRTNFITLPEFGLDIFYNSLWFFLLFSSVALIVAFTRYYYLKRSGGRFRGWQSTAYAVLALEILYALPSCSKLAVIIPIAFMVITRWYLWKKSYTNLIVAAIFILLLFPYGSFCRSPGTIEQFVSPHENKIETTTLISYSADSFVGRTGQIYVFEKILRADLPRLRGKHYTEFFVSLGPPRFIWKTKPVSINAYGNEFGKSIGVIGPENKSAIGPTIIGDFYINFGVVGIIVGMFLTGALFRFLYEYLIVGSAASASGVMTYAISWVHLMHGLESWQVTVWAGLVKTLVLLLIVHWFLTKITRSPDHKINDSMIS